MRTLFFKSCLFISIIFFVNILWSDDIDKMIDIQKQLYNANNIKKIYKKVQEINNKGYLSEKAKKQTEIQSDSEIDNQINNFLKKRIKKKKKVDPFLWWNKIKIYVYISLALLLGIILLSLLIKYSKKIKEFIEHFFRKKFSTSNIEKADVLFKNGEFKNSIEFYKKGMEALVNNEKSLKNYISALYKSNELSEAISAINILNKNFSLDNDTLFLFITLLIKTNNYKKAGENCDQLLLRSKNDQNMLIKIKNIYRKINNTYNLTETIKRLLDFNPNDIELLKELGNLYIERNMLPESLSVFQHIKDINRSLIHPYIKIAEIHLLSNNEIMAVSELENSIEYLNKYNVDFEKIINQILDKNCKNINAKILQEKILYLKNPTDPNLKHLYKELIIKTKNAKLIEKAAKYFLETNRPEIMVDIYEKLIEISKLPDSNWAKSLVSICILLGNSNLFCSYWNKLDKEIERPKAYEDLKNDIENFNFYDESQRNYILSVFYLKQNTEKFTLYAKQFVPYNPLTNEILTFEFYLANDNFDAYKPQIAKLSSENPDNPKWLFLSLIYNGNKNDFKNFFTSISNLDSMAYFHKCYMNKGIPIESFEIETSKKVFEFGSPQRAVNILNNALNSSNQKDRIKYYLSKYLIALNEVNKSKQLLEELISKFPDNLKYTKVYIQLINDKFKSEKIEHHIEKILLSTEFEKYMLFLKNILKRSVENKNPKAILLAQLGFLYYRNKNFFKGFLFMDQAIDSNPNLSLMLISYFEKFVPVEIESFIYFLKLILNEKSRLDFGIELIENANTFSNEEKNRINIIKSEFLLVKGNIIDSLELINKIDFKQLSKEEMIYAMRLKSKILSANGKKKKALELLNDIEKTFGKEDNIKAEKENLNNEIIENLYNTAMKDFNSKNWNKAISNFQK